MKINLQSDPGYHTLEHMENKIKSKLDMIKDSILETIRKENEENQIKIKEKIKTNALAVTPANNIAPPADNINLHEVVKSVRAELAEERNKAIRSKNIIVHGVAKNTEQDVNTNKDLDFAVVLIEDLHTNVTIKHVIRIGKSTNGKNRPLKIVLGCEEEKINLMGNLTALRGIEKYVGISITEIQKRKTT